MIFRDHVLSDLIGFVYSGMGAAEAAQDFLASHPRELQRPCSPAAATRWCPSFSMARTPGNITTATAGPFFASSTAAFRTIGAMEAITVSEAFRRIPPEPLTHIFPGSWINANFDVWIGAEEDNTSWRLLLDAREAVESAQRRDSPNRSGGPWKRS